MKFFFNHALPINGNRQKSVHRDFPSLHFFKYIFQAGEEPLAAVTYNHSFQAYIANESQYFLWIQVLAFAYRKQNLIFGPHFAKT
jgi:hypothetical protein